jgi:hypothetical protein
MLGLVSRVDAWRRQRRWLHERRHRFTGADVLVVSHTKSGRTWLRAMISHLYHLRYAVPERELIEFDNFSRIDPAIPKMHFTRDTRFPPESEDEGATPIDPGQKVVFLVRDPRSVAVSFYFHVTKRASPAELQRKGVPPAALSMSLYDFVTDPALGVPRVIRFYNRWAEEAAALPHSVRVRYEDLRADTAGELTRLMQLVGGDFTAEEIDGAVAFASFDAMREKERSGFCQTGRMGPTDPGDPDSAKVREGAIEGYRRRFTDEEQAVLDLMVEQQLLPDYGYH